MKADSELTEIELEQIAHRAAAATTSPWFSWVPGRNMDAGLKCIELGSCSLMEVLGGTAEDQEFIASAREDVPRLIAEVRRLRARLDGLNADTGTRSIWHQISQAPGVTHSESFEAAPSCAISGSSAALER